MSAETARIGRTVRLTPDINSRLLVLCEHLGTNPNAYLVTEIGKAVSRDEIQLRSLQIQNEAMTKAVASLKADSIDPDTSPC